MIGEKTAVPHDDAQRHLFLRHRTHSISPDSRQVP
jgi:hypothetical protein